MKCDKSRSHQHTNNFFQTVIGKAEINLIIIFVWRKHGSTRKNQGNCNLWRLLNTQKGKEIKIYSNEKEKRKKMN